MKVLFIYPNVKAQVGFNYGVAFLSAVLKERGHETALVDVNEKLYPEFYDFERDEVDYKAVLARAEAEKPDLIGFSIVSMQWRFALDIAQHLREKLPRTPLVAGGIHATLNPEEVLASGAFDYAVLGEAEYAFADFVDALAAGKDETPVPGVWSAGGVRNPVGPFPELEGLPMKDYDIFDFQRVIDAKDGWVGLLASRGCPFRCTYCLNHKIIERYTSDTGLKGHALGYMRRHPVADVVREIEYLLSRFENIKTFIFDDDLFTYDRAFVLEFAERYPEVSGVPIVVNSHVRMFDAEIAAALKRAKTKIVKFGIESGSERVRTAVLNRKMTNDEIASAFATAHEAGLATSAFVMLGMPHEGREGIEETIGLLARVKPTRFRWTLFYPVPGTESHAITEEAGLINTDVLGALTNFTDASALDFSGEYGEDYNLWLDKTGRIFPWLVNVRAFPATGARFGPEIDRVMAMDETDWAAARETIWDLDKEISKELSARSADHYRIRFNRFMGVRYDAPD